MPCIAMAHSTKYVGKISMMLRSTSRAVLPSRFVWPVTMMGHQSESAVNVLAQNVEPLLYTTRLEYFEALERPRGMYWIGVLLPILL